MDTSETYIKMCEESEEIQNNWLPTPNDYAMDCVTITNNRNLVTIQDDTEYPFLDCCLTYERQNEYRRRCIWLPRQDQLQEMVKGGKHMHLLAYEFAAYFHGSIDPLYVDIGRDNYTVDSDNSMEQMWLAFVMKKLFGKVWSGTGWVKDD